MKRTINTFLFVTLSFCITAQDYKHEKLTEDIDYLMLLDSKERLWYSDGKDIVMYDGAFHKQNIEPLKSRNKLWEDNKGAIWGISPQGIICFSEGEWKKYPYPSDKPVGSNPEIIFKDNAGRIYFFNEKAATYGTPELSVSIIENGNVTCITENLPEKINNVCEYKDGVVFGDNLLRKPCGYYNGSYEYVTEGEVYQFYNFFEGVFTSDATNLENPEMFKKYTDIQVADLAGDTLLFISENLGVCYFRNTNSFKEFKLPEEYLGFIEKNAAILYYTGNTFYIISFDKGVLEIKENSSKLYNKKNGLPDNELSHYFIDKNYSLVLMHPKASSALINGEWHHFNDDAGYDLNGLLVKNQLRLDDYRYIAAYNTELGKTNKLLRWDGATWKTYEFETKYKYTIRVSPFVYNNNIWFKHHNGNNYKGLLYFNGENFIEYPLGKKVKDNFVSSVACSEKSFYVYSSGFSGGSLFKIEALK